MPRVRTIHWLIVGLMVLSLSVISASAQEPMIGYVDMQLAIDRSKAGQDAINNLEAMGKEFKEAEQKMKSELEAFVEEIKSRQLLMTEEEKASRQEEFEDKKRELERLVNDNRKIFTREQEKYTKRIREDLLKIIQDIGEKRNYTIVLEKNFSAILYAPAKINLTEEIINRYNAEYDAAKQ